ncbi:MAG: hypothetical protein QM726_14860 [Chitinophagaceae bacterium]
MLNIAPDKWKHFFVGIAMGAFFQGIAFWLLPGHFLLGASLALGAAVCISYGWELLSLITGKGHYEIMDAVASVIGSLAGMGIVIGILAI